MKHHIIAKFNDTVADKAAAMEEARELFSCWRDYPFLSGCELIPNCIDRPNRYDLMIVVSLDAADLPLWDQSELHHAWKSRFGERLTAKAIFDCQ